MMRLTGCFVGVALVVAAGVVRAQAPSQSAPGSGSIQGLSVQLVVADPHGGAAIDSLPANARKAIGAMRDVLPYRGYRIVDTQWLVCCGPVAIPAVAVGGRLRGPDDEDYGFTATITQEPGLPVPVRFFMREDGGRQGGNTAVPAPSASEVAREIERERMLSELRRERDDVESQLLALRNSGLGSNHPQIVTLEQRRTMAERRVAEAAGPSTVARPATPRALIDTTFNISPGETVVIGTYRLRGDKALVVLLTAVPNASFTR